MQRPFRGQRAVFESFRIRSWFKGWSFPRRWRFPRGHEGNDPLHARNPSGGGNVERERDEIRSGNPRLQRNRADVEKHVPESFQLTRSTESIQRIRQTASGGSVVVNANRYETQPAISGFSAASVEKLA